MKLLALSAICLSLGAQSQTDHGGTTDRQIIPIPDSDWSNWVKPAEMDKNYSFHIPGCQTLNLRDDLSVEKINCGADPIEHGLLKIEWHGGKYWLFCNAAGVLTLAPVGGDFNGPDNSDLMGGGDTTEYAGIVAHATKLEWKGGPATAFNDAPSLSHPISEYFLFANHREVGQIMEYPRGTGLMEYHAAFREDWDHSIDFDDLDAAKKWVEDQASKLKPIPSEEK